MFWQDMLLACLHSSIVEPVTVRLIVSLEFLGDLTRVSHIPGMQATQGHITHSLILFVVASNLTLQFTPGSSRRFVKLLRKKAAFNSNYNNNRTFLIEKMCFGHTHLSCLSWVSCQEYYCTC